MQLLTHLCNCPPSTFLTFLPLMGPPALSAEGTSPRTTEQHKVEPALGPRPQPSPSPLPQDECEDAGSCNHVPGATSLEGCDVGSPCPSLKEKVLLQGEQMKPGRDVWGQSWPVCGWPWLHCGPHPCPGPVLQPHGLSWSHVFIPEALYLRVPLPW